MGYTALGGAYLGKVLNETLKAAHLAKVATKPCSNVMKMKERLRKAEITVSTEIVYPPHGDFQQQKKGGLRPKFRATHKKAPRLTYNATKEQTIKGLLPAWKVLLHKRGTGKHVYVRVIPDDDGEGLHTAQNACATIGILQGIISLDKPVALRLEAEGVPS